MEDALPPTPAPAPLWSLVLAVGIVGGLYWYLMVPRGLPIPPDAYRNEKHGFALSPPKEWLLITPENFAAFLAEHGDKVPDLFKSVMQGDRAPVSFMRIGPETQFAPSVNVVLVKGRMPRLTEAEKAEGTKAISEGFAKLLKEYTMESSELVTVDGLTSLRVVGRASVEVVEVPEKVETATSFGFSRVVSRTPAVKKDVRLRFIQTLVPGKDKGFILTASAEAVESFTLEPLFDEIVSTFRVVERPPRHGPIMTGALNGGFMGGGGYLLLMLVGRLFKRD